MSKQDLLQAILYEALGARIGLILQTSDPAKARQRLYAARVALSDPQLSHLQFRFGPRPNEIWITHGERTPDASSLAADEG